MKRQKSPPQMVEAKILGQQPEPLLSTSEISVATAGPQPTAREIQKAIDVLVAAQAASTSLSEVGSPGDVFLVYDLTLTTPGKAPYRIHSRRCFHSLLSKENLVTANEPFDTAMVDIVRPLKAMMLNWINSATSELQPSAEPPAVLTYGR